jgi:hypothetical protein
MFHFCIFSGQGKARGPGAIGNDKYAIDSKCMKTLDDEFHIFPFAISPKTVLIQNVPRDPDLDKLRGKPAKMVEIVWLQAEDAIDQGKMRSTVFVVTSRRYRVSGGLISISKLVE